MWLQWSTVVLFMFLQDPNPDDPLNHEAAEVLRDNPRQFEQSVRRSMAGGYVGGTHFPRCI
jgi:ubiquitin-conjugating enzyme E2 M